MKLGTCYIWYKVVMSVFVRPSVRKIIIHNCITNLFISQVSFQRYVALLFRKFELNEQTKFILN